MAIESGVRHRRLVGRYYCSRAIGWSLPMFIWSSQRKMLCEEVERMIEREVVVVAFVRASAELVAVGRPMARTGRATGAPVLVRTDLGVRP